MKRKTGPNAIQMLVLGFVLVTLIGAFLLAQPAAISGKQGISFVDALFTSTSAVTTTGLIVVDTGSFFSLFGQLVILLLVQIGGLGYMIIIVLLIIWSGKRVSIHQLVLLDESIGRPSSVQAVNFSMKIVFFTLFFETVGAVFLAWYWSKFFPLAPAVYSGIFHSVSAFCTAGFSIYPDSFMAYHSSIFFNGVIILLCISGSIGFIVLNDLYAFGKQIVRMKYPRRISVHTKLAVSVMGILLVFGTVIMYCSPGSIALFPVKEKILYSVFQIVSASTTTGFNSIDIGTLGPVTLWLVTILMFIGACPGGTAGGIKTTTFGLIVLSVRSIFKGEQNVNVFRREAPQGMIVRAYAVAVIAMFWIAAAVGILLITETHLSFQAILFEITSAFGTVGLSTGITAALSTTGKIVIMLTMLLGRLGPLAAGYLFVGRTSPAHFRYAQSEILVG